MQMYTPDGVAALVIPEQVPTLLENGWTKTKPVKKADAKKADGADGAPSTESETDADEVETSASGKSGSPFRKKG